MDSSRKESSTGPFALPLKSLTPACPQVADLIDFALERLGLELQHQIRHHLLTDNCSSCRNWVDQVIHHREAPPIDWSKLTKTILAPISTLPSSSDPTPVPENAKFQRQAFRELERRLGLLE
jgi:hypothetical protein